jgi:large subunit ribosomal protein L25
VSVDARALRAALSTDAGLNAVFEIDVDGAHHLAMAKVVDHHPVRHTIAHVDFLVVNRNEKVTADVPLVIVGESEALKREGGGVEQVLYALTVSMLPNDIPTAIEIDISGLEPGGAIRLADISLPHGVTTELDPDVSIVHATHAVSAEPEAGEEAGGAAEDAAPEGA